MSSSDDDPQPDEVRLDHEFMEIFMRSFEVIKNTESQYDIEDLHDKDWNREDHAVFLRNIRGIMGIVRHEVNKMALVVDVNAKSRPKVAEVTALCTGLEKACVTMWSTFLTLSSRSGATFAKDYAKVCKTIAFTSRVLLADLATSEKRRKALAHVGAVWEKCDEGISKLSDDNAGAVIQQIGQQRSLVQDALRELDEYETDPEENEWNDNEKCIAKAGLGVLRTAQATLKRIMTALKQKGNVWSSKNVKEMDEILILCEKISPLVDDFASNLYPPMDPDTVQLDASNLLLATQTAIEALSDKHFVSNEDYEDWGKFLLKGVEHNRGKFELAIAAAKIDTIEIKD